MTLPPGSLLRAVDTSLQILDPRIRAVLIDFGGVLYRTPNPHWLLLMLRLLKKIGLASQSSNGLLEMIRATPDESPFVMDVMAGRIPEAEVWASAARAWQISPDRLERMRQSAYHPRRLNWPLLEAIDRLRPHYKTALLTNAGSDFRHTFIKHYRLASRFDQVIISAEEGLVKPDPRIYTLAAGRLGAAPGECLFIDDRVDNVIGARATGMQAVIYKGLTETLAFLREVAP